jgi:release factor glutamine methyltransferase
LAKISEILQNAAARLHERGVAEARREAGSLLAFALGKDRTFLLTNDDYELSGEESANFRAVLERRANREPFQYITGRQEFYGLDFRVTPDVLIPRPETEMIVESAIEILKGRQNPGFCEIGVGSGCIFVAVLYHVKTASATGLDISERALKVARLNAENNGVGGERLKLRKSDVFEALSNEKFDLIVSNPPYIPEKDMARVQAEVRGFEPLVALTDGADGLSIIERIVAGAPRFLSGAGFLLMEIGDTQAAAVKAMFDAQIWREIEIVPDLQGIPRMVRARIND